MMTVMRYQVLLTVVVPERYIGIAMMHQAQRGLQLALSLLLSLKAETECWIIRRTNKATIMMMAVNTGLPDIMMTDMFVSPFNLLMLHPELHMWVPMHLRDLAHLRRSEFLLR